MKREVVAKLLLLNEKREALMLRTGEYKARPDKEHSPDLPGGMVDLGESERDAVVRELFEEAGVRIDPNLVSLAYAETTFFPETNNSVTKMLYTAQIDHTPDVIVSWEHESYEWHSFESFLDVYKFRPFYQIAIEYVRNNQLV